MDDFKDDEITNVDGLRAWTFRVDGKPMGWQRAGRSGATYFTQKETAAAQRMVRRAARAAGVEVIDGAVNMQCLALFALPEKMAASSKAADKEEISQRMSGNRWHLQKPDDDNIGKLVRDALNGVAYHDDAQVCGGGGVVKRWTDGAPSLTITITELPR